MIDSRAELEATLKVNPALVANAALRAPILSWAAEFIPDHVCSSSVGLALQVIHRALDHQFGFVREGGLHGIRRLMELREDGALDVPQADLDALLGRVKMMRRTDPNKTIRWDCVRIDADWG